MRKEHQNLSTQTSMKISIWLHCILSWLILNKSLLTGNSRYTPLELIVTHNTLLNMRYAVSDHVFLQPSYLLLVLLTCMESRALRKMLWASNEQTGGLVLYLHFKQIYPPDKTCIWLLKRATAALRRRWGSFARFVFKRQPTRVPAAQKPFTTEWHESPQPPEVLLSSQPQGNSSQTTALIHTSALLINSATSIN